MRYKRYKTFLKEVEESKIYACHRFKPVGYERSRSTNKCDLCSYSFNSLYEVERDDGVRFRLNGACLHKVRLTPEDFGRKSRKSAWGDSSKPKPKSEKAKHSCYEDIVTGHKFELVGNYYMPEDEYTWCAFCGGRLKKAIEIKRDDGKKFKVGETCLGNVGLVPPENFKEKMNPDSKAEEEKKSDSDISAAEIYEFLKDL